MERDLAELVRLLVDRPEKVRVTRSARGRQTLLLIHTAPEDVGKVIGRQGRTIRALRTLVEARGDRDGKSYGLDVAEG